MRNLIAEYNAATGEQVMSKVTDQNSVMILDMSLVRKNCLFVKQTLEGTTPFAAVKSLATPGVLETVIAQGKIDKFEVATVEELNDFLARYEAIKGVALTKDEISERFLSTHPQLSEDSMKKMLAVGIRRFVFDNQDQIDIFKKAVRDIGIDPNEITMIVRMIPPKEGEAEVQGMGDRFGATKEDVIQLIKGLKQDKGFGLDKIGLSFHVGTYEEDPNKWKSCINRAREISDKVDGLDILDIGGGLPSLDDVELYQAIDDANHPNPYQKFTDAIQASLNENFPQWRGENSTLEIFSEPGRSIGGGSAVIIGKISAIDKKKSNITSSAGQYSSGINFGRPPVFYNSEFNNIKGAQRREWSIYGHACAGIDSIFDHKFNLPEELQPGCFISFPGSGAYCKQMGALSWCGKIGPQMIIMDSAKPEAERIVHNGTSPDLDLQPSTTLSSTALFRLFKAVYSDMTALRDVKRHYNPPANDNARNESLAAKLQIAY